MDLETCSIENDIKVFGRQVKTFPNGIGEVFDGLIKMLPAEDKRPYYGISTWTKDGMVYIAAALETFPGEGEKYDCETYSIEKGDYLTATVLDWRQKTHCIKDVFEEMFKDERVHRSKPCVEVYKNDDEMACMMKIDPAKVQDNQ